MRSFVDFFTRMTDAASLKVYGKGYLKMKKKRVGISSWHKRYCEIDGPTLKYYDHYIRGADDNEPRGVIVLEDSPQYSINVTGSEFVIAGKYGAYIFQANSGHDALKWVEVRCRKRFVDLFFFFFYLYNL